MQNEPPNINMQFPIVVYPSEYASMGKYTAHCLNMDIIADDDTSVGAVSLLLELIETSLESAQKLDANVFRDAPKEYWDKFSQAQLIPASVVNNIASSANQRLGHGTPVQRRQTTIRELQLA